MPLASCPGKQVPDKGKSGSMAKGAKPPKIAQPVKMSKDRQAAKVRASDQRPTLATPPPPRQSLVLFLLLRTAAHLSVCAGAARRKGHGFPPAPPPSGPPFSPTVLPRADTLVHPLLVVMRWLPRTRR